MIAVALPLPPSTNELFFNTGKPAPGRPARRGRAKTRKYEIWIEEAGWELNIQRARPIKGRVKVQIAVSEDSNIDLDNHTKALVDLLVAHKLIEGDSKKHVRRIEQYWEPSVKGVVVTVSPSL